MESVNRLSDRIKIGFFLPLILGASLANLSYGSEPKSQKQQLLELESNFIGDKEQPNTSYSMPWKAPEGPEKLYRDIDSFNDFLLEPVDRDLLLRSIRFYDELNLENHPEG